MFTLQGMAEGAERLLQAEHFRLTADTGCGLSSAEAEAGAETETEMGLESQWLLHDQGLGAGELGGENSSPSPQFKRSMAVEACFNGLPLSTTIPGQRLVRVHSSIYPTVHTHPFTISTHLSIFPPA